MMMFGLSGRVALFDGSANDDGIAVAAAVAVSVCRKSRLEFFIA